MKKLFSILFALVLVVSLGLATAAPVAADPGTTYYVSTAGSDTTGDGSAGNPWKTIQYAIGQVSSGDTIMVAAGEYDAFHVIDKTNISIIGAEGATVTTADYFIVEDILVMAVVNASENINIEGINFDGTEIIDEEAVGGILYIDSTGSIADLTVENIFGADLGLGVAILGYYVDTSVVGLSGVIVENSALGVGAWNAEAHLDGCTITGMSLIGVSIGITDVEDWSGAATVNIEGSTISNNEIGILVFGDSILEAHLNNIAGNDICGLSTLNSTVTVDAIYNWWDDASGPWHSTNPLGTGDVVIGDVDFEPWLEAEVVTDTATDETVDATDEADTKVVVDGTAMVTVALYDDNPHPGGDAPTDFNALGKYIDVYVPDTTEVTEIEIRLYYTDAELAAANISDESLLQLLWWDGEEWKECSDSGVNTASTNGYSGYMWAKIREDTTPSLDYLQGGEFAAHEGPSQVPSGCFIATAAYGTDTARELDILREFRDEVLLPNSLGAKFVSLYYKTSPPLANFISQHEVLRTAVRVGFVDPIVAILNWSHALWLGRGS